MRQKVALVATVFAMALTSLSGAQASVLKAGNLNITFPDTVVITGNEIGTGSRNCTYKIIVDSDAGTTIPLRATVVVNLVDNLGVTLDNGYTQATVEGLTHMEFIGVFHCSGAIGTLKSPYKFSGTVMGVPNVWPSIEAPVTVKFIDKVSEPTPEPTSAMPSEKVVPFQNEDADFQIARNGVMSRLAEFNSWVSSIKSKYPNHISEIDVYATKVFKYPAPKDISMVQILGNTISAMQSKIVSSVKIWEKLDSLKLSITCVKGKTIKKVSGVNPSCPAGYKKK